MEAATAPTPVTATEASTGSKTMADLLPLAAAKFGSKPALRHKVDGAWQDVSYERLGEISREVTLGLMDLGIQQGDKVSILSHTRPEWTYANFGILSSGAASVSVYQTNSPEECHYVLEHSESRAVFVEDAEQLAKVRQVEKDLPNLEFIIVFEPSGDVGNAISLEDLRARGRGRGQAEFDERVRSITPDDMAVYIYTSGTTGPPKGCLTTHHNYRSVTTMAEQQGVLMGEESVYLFLPLAHAFALLIQFVTIDLGATIAYWEKDPTKIVANLSEVNPTLLPSVPRIFEKVYTLATGKVAEEGGVKEKIFWWAIGVGRKVRDLEMEGRKPGFVLQRQFAFADKQVLSKIRGLFGTKMRQCITGAAPIAQEILEFFYSAGVPVMEGYGMTETSTVATANVPEPGQFRFGSVGKPLPGVQVKTTEDGEVLIKGDNIFKGYYKNDEATRETLEGGWLHTGDLGRVDSDGFLYITGRKKDIIITAGGKNITPANLENGIKQSRWVSQAVVVGDRRPYLVALITLDPEEAPAFAEEHGVPVGDLPTSEAMRAEVQKAVDAVNAKVGPVEQIKKFAILDQDLTQETGELTPTLKVKRNVVVEKFADRIEQLYAK